MNTPHSVDWFGEDAERVYETQALRENMARLAAQVLIRAAKDIIAVVDDMPGLNDYQRETRRINRRRLKEAMSWVADEGYEASFSMWCQVLAQDLSARMSRRASAALGEAGLDDASIPMIQQSNAFSTEKIAEALFSRPQQLIRALQKYYPLKEERAAIAA